MSVPIAVANGWVRGSLARLPLNNLFHLIPLPKGLTRQDPVKSRRFHGIIPSPTRDFHGVIRPLSCERFAIELAITRADLLLSKYRHPPSKLLGFVSAAYPKTIHFFLLSRTCTLGQCFIRRSLWKIWRLKMATDNTDSTDQQRECGLLGGELSAESYLRTSNLRLLELVSVSFTVGNGLGKPSFDSPISARRDGTTFLR